MPLSYMFAAFFVGVVTCLLLLFALGKYYGWKRKREAQTTDTIRLILDTTITEDEYLSIQEQMDGCELVDVVMHALEIRGFLRESYVRGQSVYVEDEQGDRELDFNFESKQTDNHTIH